MTACLAIMAKATAEDVLAAIVSAPAFITSACVVVAPRDPLVGGAWTGASPIPVRIFERPWRGHAATRTETLRAVETDPFIYWVAMIDADDRFAPEGTLPGIDLRNRIDAFEIPIEADLGAEGRWRWMRAGHLLRARVGFRWVGEIHERLEGPPAAAVGRWDGLVVRSANPGGERAGGRTYDDDVATLTRALERDPTDTRSAFYLAQSLKDAGRYREAIAAFLTRAGMGGFAEEVFWAKLWAAKLLACCPAAAAAAEEQALCAASHSPERAEPIRLLAQLARRRGEHVRADRLDASADARPYPASARLFVDVNAYRAAVRPGVFEALPPGRTVHDDVYAGTPP